LAGRENTLNENGLAGLFHGSSFVDPLLKRSPDRPNIHKRLHPAR
jgi:hypothetical protein